MKRFECITKQLSDGLWYCSTTREIDKVFKAETAIGSQVLMESWLNGFGDKGLYHYPKHYKKPAILKPKIIRHGGYFDKGMV